MSTDRRAHIEAKLRTALDAVHVEVLDESARHAGHAGAGGGGHFRALVVSPRFAGLSRVEAQRLVYGVLAEEMGSGIHALALRTATPEEWSATAERGGPRGR